MKSIRRGQRLITLMLLVFLGAFVFLLYKLQANSSFYMSNASNVSLGMIYDRRGDVLFDPDADDSEYEDDYFLDIGNLIGDNSKQMTNTLVTQNKDLLANFSFMLGEQEDGEASIVSTLDHTVNRKVYDAFGTKNGCAVAYNYETGAVYVCLSRPSVNILHGYQDIDTLESGSLLCSVFYPTVPGSTQKISTSIAAVESMGTERLMQKSYSCSGTFSNLEGQVIRCHLASGHGTQNISQAFANSCNPFFAQLVEDRALPLSDIESTYRHMGYRINGEGEQKYIDVNGISAFTASTTLTDAGDFNTQWGCMGQGETLVSPLQLMMWQSAIAKESGRQTMPYLIDHATTVSGRVTAKAATVRSERLFSEEAAVTLRGIMLENGRNNYAAVLPGSDIGVKSGTAQVEHGDKENSLLAGFVDDPDFPIAFCIVIADRHSGEVTTSQIAAVLLQELQNALHS